ncbi:hypothetical protein LguiA_018019 [Lonicera macranthoides]
MGKGICTRTSSPSQQPQHNLISGDGDLIGTNEDLIRIILIRIPYKPITTFKTVSKLWLYVISDPDFALRWNTKHAGSTSAVLIHRTFSYKFISIDGQRNDWFGPKFSFDSIPLFDYSPSGIEVLQSCNGLLLLNWKVKPGLRLYEDRFGLYDPRTNGLKLIPKFPRKYSDLIIHTKLAFDPSKSPHYKLVSVVVFKEIFIYSSETDSWKILPDPYPSFAIFIPYQKLLLEAGVYLNGAIHWPSERASDSCYFDIDKERWIRMPMPPFQGGQEKRTIRYFGESGGHLHLIDYKDDFTLQFDVFEMAKDHSKWFVKYNVDLTALVQDSIKRFTFISLVFENGRGVEGEDESPLLVIYVPGDKMVISYKLKNGESKKLCPLSLDSSEIDDLKTKNWSKVHQITF